jgi:MFS family permease
LRRLLLSPGLIFVGLFSLMIVANRQDGRFTVMPLYGEAKGFGPDQLGAFISITHFPQFFTTMAAGFLSDRFGRKFTIVPAVALITLGIVMFILSGSFPELLLSGVLLGLGEGLAGPPTVAFFADIAPPGLEGVTMGLFRTFGGIGSLVGAILLGGVADLSSFAWSLGVDAILLIAAALGMMLLVRETAGRKAKGLPPS